LIVAYLAERRSCLHREEMLLQPEEVMSRRHMLAAADEPM
jgi:hypothetical protein